MCSITGSLTNSTMAIEQSSKERLEQRLLAAHADNDRVLLAELYEEAANLSEISGDTEGTCFYLTHALVFALQEDLNSAQRIKARLHSYGREDA